MSDRAKELAKIAYLKSMFYPQGPLVIERIAQAIEKREKEILYACGDLIYSQLYCTSFHKEVDGEVLKDDEGKIVVKEDAELVEALLDNISRVQELLWGEDINDVSIEIPEDEIPEWEKAFKRLEEVE